MTVHAKSRDHRLLVLAAMAAAAAAAGCVDEEKVAMKAENARLEGALGDCRRDHATAEARLDDVESQNQELIERMRAIGQNVTTLSEARAALQAELDTARRREEASRARLGAFRRMLSQFREMIRSGQLLVRIVRGRMVVELPEGVLFDSGSAELKESGETTLKEVARILAEIPDRAFLVAGHTDNVRVRRRFPSNWELSAARGVVVTRFLADNGVPGERLAAAGYGPFQPAATNDSDEGRMQNRRIEIVLMPNLDELPDLSELENELASGEPTPAEAGPASPAGAAATPAAGAGQ